MEVLDKELCVSGVHIPDGIVTPKAVQGYNMSPSMLFGKSPKLHVTCGECSFTFSCRTAIVDYPVVMCTCCGTRNRLPLEWN